MLGVREVQGVVQTEELQVKVRLVLQGKIRDLADLSDRNAAHLINEVEVLQERPPAGLHRVVDVRREDAHLVVQVPRRAHEGLQIKIHLERLQYLTALVDNSQAVIAHLKMNRGRDKRRENAELLIVAYLFHYVR